MLTKSRAITSLARVARPLFKQYNLAGAKRLDSTRSINGQAIKPREQHILNLLRRMRDDPTIQDRDLAWSQILENESLIRTRVHNTTGGFFVTGIICGLLAAGTYSLWKCYRAWTPPKPPLDIDHLIFIMEYGIESNEERKQARSLLQSLLEREIHDCAFKQHTQDRQRFKTLQEALLVLRKPLGAPSIETSARDPSRSEGPMYGGRSVSVARSYP